jgi:hypothetical protein
MADAKKVKLHLLAGKDITPETVAKMYRQLTGKKANPADFPKLAAALEAARKAKAEGGTS